jgi:maleylacetate reductase
VTTFRHDTLAQRVLVGAGMASEYAAAEAAERGARRVLLIGSRRHVAADSIAESLPVVARIDDPRQHVPAEDAATARTVASRHDIDLVVSIGGGSATGLAKAVALETGLPIIAIPTTFAGSEATPMWGITEGGRKVTGTDPRVLPVVVVYDSTLLAGLPRDLAVSSALNALAHSIDALWAPKAEPLSSANAEIGIRLLAAAMRALADGEPSPEVLEGLLLGGYISAIAFAAAGSGMHHKIAHVLGGRFDLPHAPLHAAVLPHVLAFNAPEAKDAAAAVARGLGADDPVSGLDRLYERLDAPRSLRDLGLREADLDEAAALALPAIPESNPRRVDLASLRALLQHAWAGSPPEGNGRYGSVSG